MLSHLRDLRAGRLRAKLKNLPQLSAAVTAQGDILGELYIERRLCVSHGSVAPSLIAAVLRAEDKRFFQHHGIDWIAVSRATWRNLRSRALVQGGSTITQQLARSVILRDRRKTLRRKIAEAIVAATIDRAASKLDILESYLNASYFGHGVFGVRLAALTTFGKEPSSLNVHESAYLAGLLQAPQRHCLCCNPVSAISRTRKVLALMGRKNNLTPNATEPISAPKPSARFTRRRSFAEAYPSTAPYFLDWVKQWLLQNVGGHFPARRLIVTTTLTPSAQTAVELACDEVWQRGFRGRLACIVQASGSGAVLAVAGGPRHSEMPFNCVTHARLQPGSLIKPFILAAAIEAGIQPERLFNSAPLEITQANGVIWRVRNFAEVYRGSITLSEALVHSDNSVYVQLALELGMRPLSHILRRVGLNPPHLTPAIATGAIAPGLSPLTLADAYGVFTSGGLLYTGTPVLRVMTEHGDNLLDDTSGPRFALAPHVVEKINTILRDVPLRGTGTFNSPLPGLCAKTGTTTAGAWYASYDHSLRVLTWVDSSSPTPPRSWTKALTAVSLAERIWGLLRRSHLDSSHLHGVMRGVGRFSVKDLLWTETHFT